MPNKSAKQAQSDGEVNFCKFTSIPNPKNLNHDQNELEADNSYEIITKIPTSWTNEEFLRYLDTTFKPEINLAEDEKKQLLISKPVENSKKLDMVVENVNLSYRGQKNMFKRGKYAERYDVLSKNFIRGVRRYLWELFEKEFDTSLLQKNVSELYRQYVVKFYDKYFKQHASHEVSETSNWDSIYFILGLLLSNKYSFPNKSNKQRKLISLFESVCHKYSKLVYQRFFLSENIWKMFLILLKSGFTDKMIDVYPNLSELKDSYLVVAKDIAYFKDNKI